MERLDVMEQVITCTACVLADQCGGPVFLSGPTPARIAVVGEAPGQQEDEQGAPFIGPAGQLMRKALDGVGIDPETVAFVNTVSCFPHGTPTWEHVHACAQNKADQLALVDAKFVLAVGKVAMKGFRPELDLKHGRGRPWLQDGRVIFATYHPAAALRNGNYEDALIDDLAVFKEMVNAEDWTMFAPAKCAGCVSEECVWFEDSLLSWCEVHLPDAQQVEYRERMAVVAADYAEVKSRVGWAG